jgi:nucleoid-associated protein YgaU
VSKSAIIAIIGGVVVVAAIALNFVLESVDEEAAREETAKTQVEKKGPAKPAPKIETKTKTLQITAPSFDIVRITPQGDTVMAGRAKPDVKVEIYDGANKIGKVVANKRGEWVFVPTSPLAPGNRRLSLKMIDPDGSAVASESDVVLVVPEKGKDIAGKSVDQPSQPLAMKVPAKPGSGVEILQKPKPDAPNITGKSVDQPSQPLAMKVPAKPGSGVEILQKPRPDAPDITLTIDAIDYDDSGKLDIIGKAPPAANINLYLNNNFFGRGKSNHRGLWRQTPERKVNPGIYTVRADLIGNDGEVKNRIEVVFARSVPLTGIKPGTLVVVESGNSLWRIARRTYGRGFRYTVIYAANKDQIKDPNLIWPGQVFSLPSVN